MARFDRGIRAGIVLARSPLRFEMLAINLFAAAQPIGEAVPRPSRETAKATAPRQPPPICSLRLPVALRDDSRAHLTTLPARRTRTGFDRWVDLESAELPFGRVFRNDAAPEVRCVSCSLRETSPLVTGNFRAAHTLAAGPINFRRPPERLPSLGSLTHSSFRKETPRASSIARDFRSGAFLSSR